MKNVFITGVSGYIGTKIVQALSGHESVQRILGIDIRKPSFQSDIFTFIQRNKEICVTILRPCYVAGPGLDNPLFLPDFLVRLLNGMAWHLRLNFLTEFPNSGLNLIRHSWVASSEKLIRHTHFKFDYDSTTAFKDFATAVLTRKTPDNRYSSQK